MPDRTDPAPDPLPLSLEQAAITKAHHLRRWNFPLRLRLADPVDGEALARALQTVVDRHEPLRMRLTALGGQVRQRIEPPGVPVPLGRLAARPGGSVEPLVEELVASPMDLYGAGPLVAALVRRDDTGTDLLLVTHHLATDNWSQDLVTAELAGVYQAFRDGRPPTLPALRASWTGHVRAQHAAGTELSTAQRLLWGGMLAESASPPRPAMADPGAVSPPAGEWATHVAADLPAGAGTAVDRFARGIRVTPAAAWQTLLLGSIGRVWESADFLYHHLHHGRDFPGSGALVGFFARSVLMRWRAGADLAASCRATLRSVAEAVRASRAPFTLARLTASLAPDVLGPPGRLADPVTYLTLNVRILPPAGRAAPGPAVAERVFAPSPFGVRRGKLWFWIDVGAVPGVGASFDQRDFPRDRVAEVLDDLSARVATLTE